MPPVDVERVNRTLRTTYWSFVRYGDTDGPSSLVAFLDQKLSHIPASSWIERFEFGGIYVNGREATSDIDLPVPARVEYYEPKFDISAATTIFPTFREQDILFDDGSIAIVYKPANLPSMPAKEQRHFSLKASLERYFGRSIHMPSRLDISAQGLVVVSTSTAAHAGLQRAFESRTAKKTYRFASHLSPGRPEAFMDLHIARSPHHPVLRTVSLSEGQPARTFLRFSHISHQESSALNVFTAHPITGRTHQIRVHAAAFGAPIAGDNFYGGCQMPYLHLVSCALSIPHPLSGKEISCEAPRNLTPAWVWPSN